jgi:hypothetical protein
MANRCLSALARLTRRWRWGSECCQSVPSYDETRNGIAIGPLVLSQPPSRRDRPGDTVQDHGQTGFPGSCHLLLKPQHLSRAFIPKIALPQADQRHGPAGSIYRCSKNSQISQPTMRGVCMRSSGFADQVGAASRPGSPRVIAYPGSQRSTRAEFQHLARHLTSLPARSVALC